MTECIICTTKFIFYFLDCYSEKYIKIEINLDKWSNLIHERSEQLLLQSNGLGAFGALPEKGTKA